MVGLNVFNGNPVQSLSSLMSSVPWPEQTSSITENLHEISDAITRNAIEGALSNAFLTAAYIQSAANDTKIAVHSLPIIQKALKRKNNVIAFTRAAKATIKDSAKPLANVPRPNIDHNTIEYTHNKVDNSQHTAIFPLGHSTTIEEMEIVIEENDALGIDTIVVPLPKMDGHEHAADGRTIDQVYDGHMRKLLDLKHPIYKNIPKYHRVSIIMHSSSSLAFERVTKQDDSLAKFARARFSNIVHHGAMLETVGSSFLFNPFLSKTYKIASATRWLKDKKVGSTAVDRYHIGIPDDINKEKYQESLKNNAEHGQAHWIKKAGQHLLKSILSDNEKNSHFQQMERTFYSGKKETAACWKTVRYYAKFMVEGAICEIDDNTDHNFVIETDTSKDNYEEIQKQCALFRQKLAKIVMNDKEPRVSMDEIIQDQLSQSPEENWLANIRKLSVLIPNSLQPQAASTSAPERAPVAA